jgi:hypothetical protein
VPIATRRTETSETPTSRAQGFSSRLQVRALLGTFSIASAMILPIGSSLFAEMVPTWANHVAADRL